MGIILDFGTARAGSSDSLTLRENAPVANNLPLGSMLRLLSGPGSVQERAVTAYDGGTKVATVSPRWRTNKILRSEELDSGSWTKNGITVTPNVATAPDGTLTADKCIQTAGGAAPHLIYQVVSRAAGVATFSDAMYFKAAELTSVFFRLTNSNSAAHASCRLNLLTGAISDQINVTFTAPVYEVEDVGGGWYRVGIVATTDAVTTGLSIQFWPQQATAGTMESEAGDGVSGIYAWAGQLEDGDSVGDYIKTVAAAITLPDATTGYEVEAETSIGTGGIEARQRPRIVKPTGLLHLPKKKERKEVPDRIEKSSNIDLEIAERLALQFSKENAALATRNIGKTIVDATFPFVDEEKIRLEKLKIEEDEIMALLLMVAIA